VLHIITRLDAGGSATNTLVSVDRLRERGFQTALAYGVTRDPDGGIGRRLKGLGIPCFYLRNLVRNPSPWRDFFSLLEIRKLLKTHSFDLIHTHSSKAGILGRRVAHEQGVPAVHTPHGHIFYGYFGGLLTRLFIRAERRAAPWATRIISLTDAETRESLARGIGRPGQYVTIPSGIPLARFRNLPAAAGMEFRRVNGIAPEAVLFVSIGRLEPVKGFDLLLHALAAIRFHGRPACLAIVGEGPERATLEQMAVDLRISANVRFDGFLEDVTPALAAADIFVLASRNEGMGRVFIEAMAAGRPVIGPRVGGVPQVIREGETGWLVEPENPEALAKAMARAAGNLEQCREMGARAAASVYPEFDEDTMIERLAAVYQAVLGARSAGGGD